MFKGEGNSSLPSTLVLVPALNEEKGVGLTLSEYKTLNANFHFLVVDGNSRDGTVHVAKSLGADVIYQRGKGKGDAIDYALRSIDTEHLYVVMTDADFTYPAEYVPKMLQVLDENPKVGMVCGNRFGSNLGVGGAMKGRFRFGNKVITVMHSMVNGVSMKDPLTGLRAIRWDALKNWEPQSDGFDIEVELNDFIIKKGLQIAEIDITYRARVGEKKLRLKDGFTILRRIFSQAFY